MRKILVERVFNNSIVESYKPNKDKDSPILGTFTVKGMTAENTISQNRTLYSSDVWNSPNAFGKGGKFIDENGKLRPGRLYGSLDHPMDNHAEFRLDEGAIAWYDVKRNPDGTWDGSAHIMNTPNGRIVKTFLDYAKEVGGSDLLGVSSRALGDTVTRQDESVGAYEAIIPEGFELMSFDFVYNPSFQSAVATLTESKKNKKTLVESIKNLAKDDKEHEKVYEEFVEKLIEESNEMNEKVKETKVKDVNKLSESKSIDKAKRVYLDTLKDRAHELYNAIYDIEKMSDEDFNEQYKDTSREDILIKLKKEYKTVQAEIDNIEEDSKKRKVKKEAKSTNEIIDEYIDEEIDELGLDDEELDEELDGEDDETPEDDETLEDETLEDETPEDDETLEIETEGEITLESLYFEIQDLKDTISELKDLLAPIEDPELIDGDLEDDVDLEDDIDLEDDDLEDDVDLEDEETSEDILDELGLTEEELESLSDEELEYLIKLTEGDK